MYKCALCGVKACKSDLGKCPQTQACPSNKNMDEIIKDYGSEQNLKIAQVANSLATQNNKTRIEETIEFAKNCGYKRIGIAFCNALSKEAKIIDEVFTYNGFETSSIMCKVGGLSEEIIGFKNSNRVLCNPIAQAKFLNKQKTDFNILIGLCIGHDTLFIKYSKAPITVLVVKDRVLAHNPLGAVYLSDGAYKNKLFPPKD